MRSLRRLTAITLLAFCLPAPAQTRPGARCLIIAADSFAQAAQSLADWRTATGMQARVVSLSEAGSSPQQVRTYIRNAWSTWPVRPEAVLLLCSPDQLPGYTYDNDCYYGDMTGDYLMEISVGRLPAWNLSECRAMLAKVLAYEKLSGWTDSSWVLRGSTVVGEDNPANPDTLYWPDCYYAQALWLAHGYTRIDSFYNLQGHTTGHLNSALNSGRSFMTYRGVGQRTWLYPFHLFLPGPYWRNGFRTPIFVGATCATVTVAPGEEMLGDLSVRFGTPESLGGAVAYFGTSRNDVACSHYRSACYRGFFKALFDEGVCELGPATVRGRWRCDSLYRDQYHYEEWTLIGDPCLRVWTSGPSRIEVEHPASVSTGPQSLNVQVRSDAGPAPGALVCAWLDTVVYALDTTDAAGSASLDINATHPGRIRLTVTGPNLAPYQGECEVHVRGSPYVIYLSHSVRDSFPAGNSDGLAGAGETLTIPLWLKNVGDSASRGTSARLRTADPYVLSLDTVRPFGTISAHDSSWTGPAGYRLFISGECPEGRPIEFALLARDTGGRDWPSCFTVRAATVSLRHAADSVADASGNGNGRLDPEETAQLIVFLRNDGSAFSTQTRAILRSADPRLVVTDSVGTWGTIPAWSIRDNSADRFCLTAGNMIPETEVSCTLYLSSLCYSTSIPLTITVGELSQFDPVADGPRRPVHYWAYDDVDNRYPEAPEFNWVELRDRGTRLTLGDNQTVTTDLPARFGPFIYYGQRYTRVSVCSNGWVAPGTTTLTSWTNTRLPRNFGGPMLAPCWDDLYPALGNGIWYWHDSAAGRFIVEWDSVHYRAPSSRWDRFQLVLHDTTTAARDGNSEFDFQFKTANNFRGATVGIQDPSGYVGITALWDTTPDKAAAPVLPGRCIRFTTDVPILGITVPDSPVASRKSISFSMYPNPCRGRVDLTLSAPGPARLDLFDISGRSVLSRSFTSAQGHLPVDLRSLPAGIYLCRLSSGLRAATMHLLLLN